MLDSKLANYYIYVMGCFSRKRVCQQDVSRGLQLGLIFMFFKHGIMMANVSANVSIPVCIGMHTRFVK